MISSMMRTNAQGNQKKRDGWMVTTRNLLVNGRKRKRREEGTLVIVIQLSVGIQTGIETRREERKTGKRLVTERRRKGCEKRRGKRRRRAKEGWNWPKRLLRQLTFNLF